LRIRLFGELLRTGPAAGVGCLKHTEYKRESLKCSSSKVNSRESEFPEKIVFQK
jgi:hypothetical protein